MFRVRKIGLWFRKQNPDVAMVPVNFSLVWKKLNKFLIKSSLIYCQYAYIIFQKINAILSPKMSPFLNLLIKSQNDSWMLWLGLTSWFLKTKLVSGVSLFLNSGFVLLLPAEPNYDVAMSDKRNYINRMSRAIQWDMILPWYLS